MKKTTKIMALAVVLALFSGLFGSIVFAQTLGERDATAKAKYQQAKSQYQKEVNFYKSARQDFLNARTKYQQYKNAENKEALEDAGKNFLEKAVSSLIKRLETVKNWVSNNRALPESERQTIIAEINQDINWLNERLPNIQTASPAQIKEEAKIARDYWKNHRVKVKRITGEILAARINFLIAKAEKFSAEVSAKIDELKAAGKDTSQLEAWLSDFNQKLALTKEKYDAGKAKFQAIKGGIGPDFQMELAEADKLFREGNQFIKEANKYIKEAHALLVKIVKEMKKMNSAVEVPVEPTATSTQ